MPVDLQATGYVGIAFESVAGTYVAPTKFFPIRSESFLYNQDTHWRRPIRQINDTFGAVAGDAHATGDMEMELLADVVPYFLYASRNTVVKTGAAAPFTYTTTPFHGALPTTGRTLSITVVRAGVVFGYTGCIVGSMRFATDGPVAIFACTLLGRNEASAALPTATFTAGSSPFGAGSYSIQVPTATQVFDVDTFALEIEDNGTPEFRLKNTMGAAYLRYGERAVTLNMDHDFESRTEYDAYKALTAQSITIDMTKGADKVTLKVPAGIKDSYDIGGLSAHGDLVRASVSRQAVYDAGTSKSYEVAVVTSENIV